MNLLELYLQKQNMQGELEKKDREIFKLEQNKEKIPLGIKKDLYKLHFKILNISNYIDSNKYRSIFTELFLYETNKYYNKMMGKSLGSVNDNILDKAKNIQIDIDLNNMSFQEIYDNKLRNECYGKCREGDVCKGGLTEVYIPELRSYMNFCKKGLAEMLNQNDVVVFVKGLDY